MLDVRHAELLFIGVSSDLNEEDEGIGKVAQALEHQVATEMTAASREFGVRHVSEKVYEDLHLKTHESLGPDDAIVQGKLA